MPWEMGGESDLPRFHSHPLKKYRTKAALKRGLIPVDCLVKREEWGGVPPISTEKIRDNIPSFMKRPPAEFAHHIHFNHTMTTECTDSQECAKIVKSLQEKHMEAGETDILHSFVIGGDGKIYEGRGWDVQCKVPEEFTATMVASLDFAIIGDFSKKKVPKIMIQSFKKLTEWAILNKKLCCCFFKSYDYELHSMFFGSSIPEDYYD